MTFTQRIVATGLACATLLSGYTFGRMTESPNTQAETNPMALTASQPQPAAASEAETFYLKDFKTGYDEGFAAGKTGQTNGAVATEREGYNEGFKKGYADAYQPQQNTARSTAVGSSQQMANRPSGYSAKRGNSKLKTALTIAAPAAIGAGIGAAAGGKKGAAAGALIGGGGGALYHVMKNR